MSGPGGTGLQPMDDRSIPSQPLADASDTTAIMRMIESAMLRPDFDVAKLNALIEIKERWDKREAEKAFHRAFAGFKSEDLIVLKNKQVSFPTKDQNGRVTGETSYWHAELSDLVEKVAPALSKYGLSHAWDVSQGEGRISVTCVLTHELGHSKSVTLHGLADNSGKKNAIQQVQSTITYLERGTLQAVCGIATKGQDDDGRASAEDEPEKTPDELAAEATAAEKAKSVFANHAAAIEAATSIEDLQTAKSDMAKAYANMVPEALVDQWNARKKVIAKKATPT